MAMAVARGMRSRPEHKPGSGRARRGERAQATVEYIFLLAVAIFISLMVLKSFLKPFVRPLSDSVGNYVNKTFSSDSNVLHKWPYKPK
jgi:hypothetical protein